MRTKLKGKLTILCTKEGVSIRIEDAMSSIEFVNLSVSTENFCAALGRLACVECDMSVGSLDLVGKKMEVSEVKMELPDGMAEFNTPHEEILDLIQSKLPSSVIADRYLGKKDSFFKKDGKNFVRCTVRRWV